ncbi:MAG: protein kinase [Acidobacteria bacterium]|nr:protein kinase [Acidobacteriota bacterium]
MALAAGTRLGPYEILAPLGAGGMGEVYRARDPRLGREVALKVLPPDVASDPERLERFEREARALAALNHPHIVTIYSVEEVDGRRFLTMELVAGSTLSQIIPQGGLPLPYFLRIAVPLAEAVHAAHQKGITHRDLKPANVMVTEDGLVKVLDFGLARLQENAPETVDTETTTRVATSPGRVMGTAPYMSPEQVEGKPVDHRSDVFSLGVVFYEMATGRRPFAGGSQAALASAILKDAPTPLTELRPDLPPDLGRVIRRCLEKERRRRFQSVLDLRNELEDLAETESGGRSVVADARPRFPSRSVLWVAAALGLAVLLWSLRKPPPPAPLSVVPLTSFPGDEVQPALSPDGTHVAFRRELEEGGHLYVKVVDGGGEPVPLTQGGVDDSWPAWSPDGTRVAFLRRRSTDELDLLEIAAVGGPTRRLGVVRGSGQGLSYSPDGEFIAVPHRESHTYPDGIFLVSTRGDGMRRLTSPPVARGGRIDDIMPSFSPDGRSVAFLRQRGLSGGVADVYTVPLEGGAPVLVLPTPGMMAGLDWSRDGASLVLSIGMTWEWRHLERVQRGGGGRTEIGEAQRAAQPSVARRRNRLVFVRDFDDENIWVIGGPMAKESRAPRLLAASTWADLAPEVSPDGQRVAFVSGRSGTWEIWTQSLDGSDPRQITRVGHAIFPRWSPDGVRIAFNSCGGTPLRCSAFVVDAAGGPAQELTPGEFNGALPDWSPDGEWLYFQSDRQGERQLWRVPSQGGKPALVTRQGGTGPTVSESGAVFFWREGGIWSVPPNGGETTLVLDMRGEYFAWDVWGHSLVFFEPKPAAIMLLDLETGETRELTALGPHTDVTTLSVSPDGRHILYSHLDSKGSDIMLLDGFQ